MAQDADVGAYNGTSVGRDLIDAASSAAITGASAR
jgi:hypothetical protein